MPLHYPRYKQALLYFFAFRSLKQSYKIQILMQIYYQYDEVF